MSLQLIRCPACGSRDLGYDNDGNMICNICGTSLEGDDNVVYCTVCHTANQPDALRCVNCDLSLGRTCAVCGTVNPPSKDVCTNCETPLDRLTSVILRTPAGRHESAKILREDLVRAKTEDFTYMGEQRKLLDEEEKQRQAVLLGMKSKAQQQQLVMTIITLIGLCLLLAALAYYVFVLQ